MRFLITGGAGFLGTALANHLVQAGHTVRVLDDLSSGDTSQLHEDVHFTRGDIEDKPKVWRLLNKVDCVYHLAARVSVPESILYPREYNKANVSGTVAMMEALRDAGVKRVVFASSGAVYGEQDIEMVHEDLLPAPTSPYAVSKLAAEGYVRTIGGIWGIETVSLRIFNAYGPEQNVPPAHPPVIPQFIRQILGGGSIIMHDTGRQIRDYVYIDDVVQALASAATAPNIDRQIINVGTGVGTSIKELIQAIEQATGKKAKIIANPSVSGGVSSLVANINWAKALLDYEPKTTLSDGLLKITQKLPV